MGHSPVAVQTHGSESEDGGMHGEEVQAQEEAAAHLTKGPARCQTVIHNEWRGKKVEEVGKCKAQHLQVKRGRGGGIGDGRRGRGRGVGKAGW